MYHHFSTLICSPQVHEERQQKRISLAIKAVKVITDILPFDDISEQLIREESLVKYLFVAYPILPSPVNSPHVYPPLLLH